jgi:cytochrome c-type biogenesis protein CcmH/NrfG
LEAGDSATAALFYEHASKLNPDNEDYLAMFLQALDVANPPAAGKRA